MLNKYIDSLLAEKSSQTARAYRQAFRHWDNFKDLSTLANASIDTIESFVKHLKKQKTSIPTIKFYLGLLSHFSDYLIDKELATTNFFRVVRRWLNKNSDPIRPTATISESQLAKILGAATTEQHHIMLKFLFSTGVRISEMLNLKVADLNHGNKITTVTIQKTKTKKPRTITLEADFTKEFSSWFQRSKDKKSFLFINPHTNTKYSYQNFLKVFRFCCAKANVKAAPHAARAYFITKCREQNINPVDVADYVGHRSLSTTRLYDKRATIRFPGQ